LSTKIRGLERCTDEKACEIGRLALIAITQPDATIGKVAINKHTGQRQKRFARNKDQTDFWTTLRPSGRPAVNTRVEIDDTQPLDPLDQAPNHPPAEHVNSAVIAACERILDIYHDNPTPTYSPKNDGPLVRIGMYGKEVLDILYGTNRGNLIPTMMRQAGGEMVYLTEQLAIHAGDPNDRLYGGIIADDRIPILGQ
jgi:hypothetical protein